MSLPSGRYQDEPITLADRVVTAGLTSVLMSITLLVAPIGLALAGARKAWRLYEFYDDVLIWGSVIVVASAITGFILGTERTVDLFSHLWGTAEPRHEGITASLWIGIAVCAIITYFLVHRITD
jgi:hypothetical protein